MNLGERPSNLNDSFCNSPRSNGYLGGIDVTFSQSSLRFANPAEATASKTSFAFLTSRIGESRNLELNLIPALLSTQVTDQEGRGTCTNFSISRSTTNESVGPCTRPIVRFPSDLEPERSEATVTALERFTPHKKSARCLIRPALARFGSVGSKEEKELRISSVVKVENFARQSVFSCR